MMEYNDYMKLKKLFYEWRKMGVPMSEDIKRLYWRELKRLERSTRCRTENGIRCMGKCRNCPKQRSGGLLSLEAGYESGKEIADPFSVEYHYEKKELSKALVDAISTLNPIDKEIIILYSNGVSEQEIGAIIGMSQKGVNNRKHKILSTLRVFLKDYA